VDQTDNETMRTWESKQTGKSTEILKNLIAKAGLEKEWTRATFVIRQKHLEKLKNLAWWERVHIKDVLDQALEDFFKDKKVDSIPSDKKPPSHPL
jgi:hypothetical protein